MWRVGFGMVGVDTGVEWKLGDIGCEMYRADESEL
jgi:hypothetical protein